MDTSDAILFRWQVKPATVKKWYWWPTSVWDASRMTDAAMRSLVALSIEE